jgi:lipopolysaccharide/colanic/teichoic acid biosynthesis glycosyltransferase/glycosyltransferase involved in cell wall biosynthesis
VRILLIKQFFDPEPTAKGLALARALQELGHEVEVITGFPNYPGGKVYPGYRIKLFQIDIMDGVRVVRVPLYPSHDDSGLKRALNYVTFMLSSLIIGGVLTRKPDVIYAYHPPLTTGISAVFLGLFKGAPFVYDIQDLWPDTIGATGMLSSPRALQVIENVCQWVYARARNIIVLSNGFKTRLEERGVPAGKLTVIPNWADESQIQLEDDPELKRDLGVGERFNIVFAGTMGKAQALESVLETAATLQVSEPRVQFVFVGGGVELPHLQQVVLEKGLSNVRFLARRPMSEIGRVLACADALLVHLKDDPLFEITIPSKMQAYMAVGKPVLMAVRGDAAAFIRESEGGLCCEPENPASLGAAIGQLLALSKPDLEAMGRRGQTFYRSQLAIRVGVKRIEAVFEHARGSGAAYSFTKRFFDFLVSFLALVLLSPVMIVVAYMVRSKLGSPIIFSQLRPGLHGQPFQMFKFRTMTDARDAVGNLLSDADRLTDFGKWLRTTSLDELPALWNVVRGEMSLVGPRPLRVHYLDRYSPEQARRHDVRPGITGWAQVNGRNAISWVNKFRLDVWYVDHQSFWLDLKILLLTVQKVFRREGVNAAEDVTMPEFMGSTQHHE